MAEEEDVVDDVEEEEDEEDPQDVLKEKCGDIPKCSKFRDELESCNERVTSKARTTETCVQEIFDFVHCVDHCVAKNLLQKLK